MNKTKTEVFKEHNMTPNYKNYYAITTNWLNTTVKNIHYFASTQTVSNLKVFTAGYRETIEELEANLSISWSKEEYLHWIKMWKASYNKLMVESRMAKNHRKSLIVGDAISTANITSIDSLRSSANRLLALRKTAKEFAEVAYQKFNLKVKINEVA